MIEEVRTKSADVRAQSSAAADGSLPARLEFELCVPDRPFVNAELLLLDGMDARAGSRRAAATPALADILQVPPRAHTAELALASLVRAEKVVQALLDRAKDASSSSRIAQQHQVQHAHVGICAWR